MLHTSRLMMFGRRTTIHRIRVAMMAEGEQARNVDSRQTRCATSSSSFPCSEDLVDDDHPPPPAHFVDVAPLAEAMRAQVREYTQQQEEAIRLVGIVANTTPEDSCSALVYSEHIAETFAQDGIAYETKTCRPGGIVRHPLDVEAVIREMNARKDVHGILVFYPIFKGTLLGMAARDSDDNVNHHYYLNRLTGVRYKTQDDYLRDLVDPSKDVEGLCHNHHHNAAASRLFRARGGPNKNRLPDDAYVPCTAQAVTKILAAYHQPSSFHQLPSAVNTTRRKQQRWSGCTATVINRSEICGRPLAALLALEGATVYSVDETSILEFLQAEDDHESSQSQHHHGSSNSHRKRRMRRSNKTLKECVMESSIVVTGVPSPDFSLPTSLIQPDTTLINVSEYQNVNEEALWHRPDIQFVPHIGKVTVASLEQNLIRLYQQRQKQQQEQSFDLS